MERFSLKQFKKQVAKADVVYGVARLNAAISIPSRIRKKHLLAELDRLEKKSDTYFDLGYYAQLETDHKGRQIMKIL